MTKQTPTGQSPGLFSSRGAAAAALGLIGGLALAVSGCDTVAQISFTQRGFNEIHSSGFVPAAGGADACEGMGNRMTMRFVMTDGSRRPIRLGDTVRQQSVELTGEDITFRDSALFEVSQQESDAPDVTGLREASSCTSGDDCGYTGFQCGRAPTIPDEATYDACFTGSTLAVTSAGASEKVRFVSNLDRSKVLGVVTEVSSSTVGFPTTLDNTDYKPGEGLVYWDQDGDETGDVAVEPEGAPRDLIASDPDNTRASAMGSLLTSAILTQRQIADDGRGFAVGAWRFSSEPEAQQPLEDAIWATTSSGINSLLSEYRSDLDPPKDTLRDKYANMYFLVAQLIRDNFNDETIGAAPRGGSMLEQGVDKTLIMIVDGPDDARGDLDDLVAAANDLGVQLFIVQYDPAFDAEAVSEMYTPPQYVAGQDACESDADCKNFETCRPYKGFSSDPGEATTGNTSDKFCVPHRDENGRYGPIADYQRLACETGGGYIYLRSVDALPRVVSWLPSATEGLWEVDVSSTGIDSSVSDQDTGSELLLQTLVDINVGGTNKTYQFSQVGGRDTGQADTTDAETDTRAAVVTTPQ